MCADGWQDLIDTKKKLAEYAERGYLPQNSREIFLMNVSALRDG